MTIKEYVDSHRKGHNLDLRRAADFLHGCKYRIEYVNAMQGYDVDYKGKPISQSGRIKSARVVDNRLLQMEINQFKIKLASYTISDGRQCFMYEYRLVIQEYGKKDYLSHQFTAWHECQIFIFK
jgi:hypothetical protein